MKTLCISAFALAFIMLFTLPALAKDKEQLIGYVNLQKALNESEAGIKAKEFLRDESKKIDDSLTTKQEELKKLRDDLEKKGSVMTKEGKEAKEQELRTKGQDFQKIYMELNEQLGKKQQEKQEQIIGELYEIVDEVARKRGFTYVFERSMGLLYAPPEGDITEDVIKTHNKRFKAKAKEKTKDTD